MALRLAGCVVSYAADVGYGAIWQRPEFWIKENQLWEQLTLLDPNVAVRVHRCSDTGCWLWKGCTVPSVRCPIGYGKVQRPCGSGEWKKRRNWVVHRWVYNLLLAPIPNGFELHHWCAQKLCCNPLQCEPIDPLAHAALEMELTAEGYIYVPPPRPFISTSTYDDLPF